MAKSPNWTKEEIDVLTSNYPLLGRCKELQDLFPTRTMEGISLKANRIGLRVLNNIREGRTNEEYLELLESTNFIAMEKYKGSTVPILHMCGDCEHEWLARPQHLLRLGAKCPVCSLKARFLSTDTVDATLNKVNLTRLSNYTGSLDKLLVMHNTCAHEWWTVYSYIEQGSGCPKCNRGFGYKCKDNAPDTAILYLFKIAVEAATFLKLGITCRPIKTREREIRSSIGIEKNPNISLITFVEGSSIQILDAEWGILHKYKKYTSSIKFVGNTELLNIEDMEEIMKDMKDMKLYGHNI